MKIATKIRIAIVSVIFLQLLNSVVLTVRSTGLQKVADEVLTPLNVRMRNSVEWAGLVDANAARVQALAGTPDAGLKTALGTQISVANSRAEAIAKALIAGALPGEEAALAGKLSESRQKIAEAEARLVASPDAAAELATSQWQPLLQAYREQLLGLIQFQEKEIAELQADSAARRSNNVRFGTAMILLILSGMTVGAFWMVRAIRVPLEQANRLAASIAKGDLSQDVVNHRSDEFGELMQSLSRMNESLAVMVAQVRSGTDNIALASAEIASGNNDLSQRTESTSGDLQATASSMEELTTTVQQSAENARQASALASSASAVAVRGGAMVREIVTTMEAINDSSRKINDIISVIDGIAFQTNILALNAAVEAARAGEQGRGFAVVASEVRSLAQRSAEAAKEIKSLIGNSVEKVEGGMALVADAGGTMNDIVQSVQRVTDVVNEITAAASEQSGGIAKVNSAIANLDQMTQQNAALVEESAAAAQSMQDQAQQLAQSVAQFKLRA
jgi:methyl-accepting chemotaxis protein